MDNKEPLNVSIKNTNVENKGNVVSSIEDFFKTGFVITLFGMIVICIVIYLLYYLYKNWKTSYNGLLVFIGSIIVYLFIYYIPLALFKNKLKSNNPNDVKMSVNFLKYIYIFLTILLVIGISLLFHYNPYHFMDSYSTISIFLSIFLFSFMLFTISYYSFLKNPKKENGLFKLFKYILVIFSIFILLGFVVYILVTTLSKASSNKFMAWLIDIGIILLTLSVIYKLLEMSGLIRYFEEGVLGLIVKFIFYIPCLFVDLINAIIGEYKSTNIGFLIIIIMEIIFILSYYIYNYGYTKYIEQGGKQLINSPIPLNTFKILSSYNDLNDMNNSIPTSSALQQTNKVTKTDTSREIDGYGIQAQLIELYPTNTFVYNYAISFWFSIDTNSPNTNYISILNYGNKPNVLYRSDTNILIVTVKQQLVEDYIKNNKDLSFDNEFIKVIINNVPMEINKLGERIIYKNNNIMLQKWNNMIVNYNGGTMDIFLNGELGQSNIEIVPYMSLDQLTCGSNTNFNGGICNVLYFKKNVTMNEVYKIYNSLKNKNPPVTPNLKY
jgi:hypothetical protein